jgi:hypothetical protein
MLIQNSNPVIHQELRTATTTELVLVPITNVVFSWMPHETKVPIWLKSLAFRMCLSRAYATFAHHYPDWVETLFDEHFVQHRAAPLLKRYLRPLCPPAPIELATLWATQFSSDSSAAKRYATELIPAAADFLGWLEAELHHHPMFRNL